MSGFKPLVRHLTAVAVLALTAVEARAQWGGPSPPAAVPAPSAPAAQGGSRGENFSAKPPAQLFASDCTGAGCHKGPQGLGAGRGQGSLTGFLREHYTNSRESAAALAGYLVSVPGDARAAKPDPRQPRTATRGDETAKPAPDEAARTRKPPAAGETSEPAKPSPAPAAKPPRGRQAAGPPATPPATPAAATTPAPEPAATPAAPPVAAPPAVPPKPQWDIFD